MKFFEFFGLFVEFFEGTFRRDVIDAGVNVISKYTDKDEWADEGGMEDTPEDDTSNGGGDES